MKLHIHIKKLFDAGNHWLNHEKRLAKENANKARGTSYISIPIGSSRRWYNPFGYIWWRDYGKRGRKTPQGKLLPQTRGSIKE